MTASQVSDITKINRNTVNRYFKLIREKILLYCEKELSFTVQVELDESYFGGRKKGLRGRGSKN